MSEQTRLEIEESIRANKILEDADKVRKAGLFNTTIDGFPIITGSDSDRDDKLHRHDFDPARSKAKHGRDAFYFFPESFNELRKELTSGHWENLWAVVGWRMAHRAEEFVECMNEALDLAVVFDTEKVDFISRTYLNELRKRRGAA